MTNQSTTEMMLFDFTTTDNVTNWYEVSDTVRNVGKSKATLVLQKTKIFQRAIFFALLNPQTNGACFAGMDIDLLFQNDFSGYSGLEIRFKSQGQNVSEWKLKLKTDISVDRFTSYQQKFSASKNNEDFETAFLAFSDFHQDVNGEVPEDEIPLNLSKIKTIGIQAFGGVYDSFKQNGPVTLELEYIKLIEK